MDTKKDTGEKQETEPGVTHLQAEDTGIGSSPPKLGERPGTEFPQEPPMEGAMPAAPGCGSGLQKGERTHFVVRRPVWGKLLQGM